MIAGMRCLPHKLLMQLLQKMASLLFVFDKYGRYANPGRRSVGKYQLLLSRIMMPINSFIVTVQAQYFMAHRGGLGNTWDSKFPSHNNTVAPLPGSSFAIPTPPVGFGNHQPPSMTVTAGSVPLTAQGNVPSLPVPHNQRDSTPLRSSCPRSS